MKKYILLFLVFLFQGTFLFSQENIVVYQGDTVLYKTFVSDIENIRLQNHSAVFNLKDNLLETIPLTSIDSITFANENSIIDTLRGEWRWFKRGGGYAGRMEEPTYTSIIKILNQNEDESIDYEVYASDTLFYKGEFRFDKEYQWWPIVMKNDIKLPHYSYNTQGFWYLQFYYPDSQPSKDTICFYDGAMDGYKYFYQKINEEE